ncbi:hypothetical protein BG004_003584 [Podila humilis]|nr:hypothetical protein BG004_003584 [Podila humilis]
MEENMTAQQQARIANLLALDVQDFTMILDHLGSGGDQARSSLNKLVQQLDEKAIQFASEDYRSQAEVAKAELATLKIAFEQRAQTNDSRIKAMKAQLDAAREKTRVEQKEKEEAVAKSIELESRYTSQQSGSLHAGVELDSLKAKVETLEVEKREALSAHERKTAELDQLNEDYRNLSANYQEVKKESDKYETDAREAKSLAMSHQLQQDALKQEVKMLKQRMEWTTKELEAKSAEFNTYRNEKSAQILRLQSELDQARLDSSTATQSNTNLQRRLKELQDKLEESLVKIQELQAKGLTQEENFRSEMALQERMADLCKRRSEEDTERVQQAEHKIQLQSELDKAMQEIERLKAEQKRADELLEKAGLTDASSEIGRMGILSPTAALVGKMQKTGMSLTQVYARYMELQGENSLLKSENNSLRNSMTDIVKELADGAPLIQEQRIECQRLKIHAEELSAQLESSLQEKEQIAHGARELLTRLDSLNKECENYRKENQDLDRQIHNLLWRIKAPNAPQSMAPEATRSVHSEDATDAEWIIDEHFVTFANIQELQKQNKKLREVARQLTRERTASEEAKEKARSEEEQNIIQEAKQKIESMREELGSKEMQIATYKQETDMLRRTLKASNIRFATTASVEQNSAAGTPEPIQTSEALEYAKLLGELQKNFDAYRNETAIDTKYMKEQLTQLQSDNSEYRIKLGRAEGQVELLEQRYQLAMENNKHQMTEMAELRKQASHVQDIATRHEISNLQLTADLLAERDIAARLKSEIGNLKQEHALSRRLEAGRDQELESIKVERNQLRDMLEREQRTSNEAERSREQAKRRLEVVVTSKEQEVEALKEKLKEEIESSRRLRDRKEIEAKEWQSRIDRMTAEHQSTRESLIEAKISLEHTSAKVEDLTKQLKSREDQLAIYQQKTSGSDMSEATLEEKLQAQVSQLRTELERRQKELSDKSEHLAQFQAISQANEDRLAEMNVSFELFKKEHDEILAQRDETIRSLESKLADAEERAQTAATSLIEMQNRTDAERDDWKAEKSILEGRIRSLEEMESQMKDIESQYRKDLSLHSNNATTAHENYQRELLNHARDMEALSALKQAHSQQSSELSKEKSRAEAAVANLQSAEMSWESQRHSLQKSLSEAERRCTELKEQNEKLHLHLEDVNAKASSLRRLSAETPIVELADGVTSEAEGFAKGSQEHQLAELRDVIRYVRREKEIVECQHELTLQECRRLKQQVEETNRSLAEARSLLTKERSKQEDAMVSKEKHDEILEKINQINLLRESNTMLRAENDRLNKRVGQLEETAREFEAKLDPLTKQLRDMTSDLETSKEERKQLTEDRDRWKHRTEEIMRRHDRIDPTEFKELKDKLIVCEEEVERYKADVEKYKKAEDVAKAEMKTINTKTQEAVLRANKMTFNTQAWRKRFTDEAATTSDLRKQLEASQEKIADLERRNGEATSKGSSSDAANQREKEILQKTLETVQKAKDALAAEKATVDQNLEITQKRLANIVSRYKEVMKNQPRTAGGDATNAQAAIDAAVKAKEEELEKKLVEEKAAADAHKMNDMRSKMLVQARDKMVMTLREQLISAGIQPRVPPPATVVASSSTTTEVSTPSTTSGLSVAASGSTPQATGRPPRIVRPTGAGAVTGTVATPPAATAVAARAAVASQNVRPRPAAPSPQQPNAAAGIQRLRPPLSERNVTATSGTITPSAPPPATPVAVANKLATPAAPGVPVTSASVTATTPAGVPALASNPSRGRMIKRRKEGELPLVNPATANLTQDTDIPGGAAPPASTGTTATGSIAAPSPLVKREPAPTETQSSTTPATLSKDAKTTGVSTMVSTTVAAVSSSTTTSTSTPHGQKRRLEATETVQENITIVSTPNPADLEYMDDVAPGTQQAESTAMDVDEAPPVKRIRPTSHVVITEIPEEQTVSPPVADLPTTPGASEAQEEYEEEVNGATEQVAPEEGASAEDGEVTDETQVQEAESSTDAVVAESEESQAVNESAEPHLEEDVEEGQHMENDGPETGEQEVAQESVQDDAAGEDEFGMTVDGDYESLSAAAVLDDEDYDVSTPLVVNDDEEVFDDEEGRDQGMDTEGQQSREHEA